MPAHRLSALAAALLAMASPAMSEPTASPAVERWHGGEYKNCDGSTADMVDCIAKLRDRWDGRLNAAYKSVMATLEGERKDAFRDTQRKWIAYRDANCLFYANGEGSISRIEAATCQLVLTRDRAQELQMMLEP